MKLKFKGNIMVAFFNGNSAVFSNSNRGFHNAVKWLEGLL